MSGDSSNRFPDSSLIEDYYAVVSKATVPKVISGASAGLGGVLLFTGDQLLEIDFPVWTMIGAFLLLSGTIGHLSIWIYQSISNRRAEYLLSGHGLLQSVRAFLRSDSYFTYKQTVHGIEEHFSNRDLENFLRRDVWRNRGMIHYCLAYILPMRFRHSEILARLYLHRLQERDIIRPLDVQGVNSWFARNTGLPPHLWDEEHLVDVPLN